MMTPEEKEEHEAKELERDALDRANQFCNLMCKCDRTFKTETDTYGDHIAIYVEVEASKNPLLKDNLVTFIFHHTGGTTIINGRYEGT